jgi:Arc/MetJ-type ribon-helix-helix transcriptional regulator
MNDKKKGITITIPINLADKLKKRIENTNFNSISSYITYIMGEVLLNLEKKEKENTFSEYSEEKVKKRLKDLGYL